MRSSFGFVLTMAAYCLSATGSRSLSRLFIKELTRIPGIHANRPVRVAAPFTSTYWPVTAEIDGI